MTRRGGEPPTVLRTETDRAVAWLAVPDPRPDRVSVGLLVCNLTLLVASVLLDAAWPLHLLILVMMGIWGALVLSSPPPRPPARVTLDRRGVTCAALAPLRGPPTSALDGRVADEVTVTWDELHRFGLEQGRIAVGRTDGTGMFLPELPSAAAREILERIDAHHRAFEAAAVPREEAALARARLGSLLDREGRR